MSPVQCVVALRLSGGQGAHHQVRETRTVVACRTLRQRLESERDEGRLDAGCAVGLHCADLTN